MSERVLLNIDLGELPGEPDELYASADVANVACGGHAGDEGSMRSAVIRCRAHGAKVGAHPSYADRDGFGRHRMDVRGSALSAIVAAQCARLADIAGSFGEPVAYVKAHGALYHAAREDRVIAEALIDGFIRVLGRDAVLIGPARGELAKLAAHRGLRYAREAFADRNALPDGTLVPRGQPEALVLDPAEAARRAQSLASGGGVETVCVHGDTPGAVAIARAVRIALEAVHGP